MVKRALAGLGMALALTVGLALASVITGAHAAGGADVGGACEPGEVSFAHLFLAQNYCFHEVQTPSGRANFVFHAELIPGSPAPSRVVSLSNFSCTTTDGVTFDSKAVITPGGQINGECHYP